MINLIKYELMKERTSKIVLAGLLLVAELAYIIGIAIDKEDIWGMAILAFTTLAMITFIIVAFEVIFTYDKDLKNKSGYMLFMTPNSVYKILGSKILTGILSISLATLIFGLLTFLNMVYATSMYGELEMILQGINRMLESLFSVQINWVKFILTLITLVLGWISMVTSAFLAITLCDTLLFGMKIKGIISFIGFIALNWAFNTVTLQIDRWLNLSNDMAELALLCGMTVIFGGACYFFAGYVLNKELAL